MTNPELPAYRCDVCDTRPWLMSDETAGMATLGLGCECTLEAGRPFFGLKANAMNLPERWVKQ